MGATKEHARRPLLDTVNQTENDVLYESCVVCSTEELWKYIHLLFSSDMDVR